MHVNILELNFLYLVGASFFYYDPHLISWLVRLLVWRKMFSCGVGKLVIVLFLYWRESQRDKFHGKIRA